MPGSEAAKAVKIPDGNKKDINIECISAAFAKYEMQPWDNREETGGYRDQILMHRFEARIYRE